MISFHKCVIISCKKGTIHQGSFLLNNIPLAEVSGKQLRPNREINIVRHSARRIMSFPRGLRFTKQTARGNYFLLRFPHREAEWTMSEGGSIVLLAGMLTKQVISVWVKWTSLGQYRKNEKPRRVHDAWCSRTGIVALTAKGPSDRQHRRTHQQSPMQSHIYTCTVTHKQADCTQTNKRVDVTYVWVWHCSPSIDITY